jgi:hypothetical protein
MMRYAPLKNISMLASVKDYNPLSSNDPRSGSDSSICPTSFLLHVSHSYSNKSG